MLSVATLHDRMVPNAANVSCSALLSMPLSKFYMEKKQDCHISCYFLWQGKLRGGGVFYIRLSINCFDLIVMRADQDSKRG